MVRSFRDTIHYDEYVYVSPVVETGRPVITKMLVVSDINLLVSSGKVDLTIH